MHGCWAGKRVRTRRLLWCGRIRGDARERGMLGEAFAWSKAGPEASCGGSGATVAVARRAAWPSLPFVGARMQGCSLQLELRLLAPRSTGGQPAPLRRRWMYIARMEPCGRHSGRATRQLQAARKRECARQPSHWRFAGAAPKCPAPQPITHSCDASHEHVSRIALDTHLQPACLSP